MNDLIRRKDVEQMLTALGGCDASDKEAAGWDKAIDAALEGLRKVESASGKVIEFLMECKNIQLRVYKEYGNLNNLATVIMLNSAIMYIEKPTEPYKED